MLVLDAGDQFQGSLFYTKYKGEAAVEFMNAMKIDAMAVGNHEFDDGPEFLQKFVDSANFPVVSANIVAKKASKLDPISPYTIFELDGRKVAVIGALAEDTGETSSPGPHVSFASVVDRVQNAVKELEAKGIDHIIMLSHIGLPVDKRVVSQLKGIDLVIGGHSHTLLSNTDDAAEGPYPVVVKDSSGTSVPIVQAWAYSRIVGDFTVTFDDSGKVTAWKGEAIAMGPELPETASMVARVAELAEPLNEIRQMPVGKAATDIDGSRETCRARECTMGNLVADALLWATKDSGTEIAIQNGGGLRASIGAGTVTMGDVLTVLPFQNAIATFKLKGSDVVDALQHGTSKIEDGHGRFPQVSGLRYTLEPTAPVGSRVSRVEVRSGSSWAAINPDKIYSLVSNDFLRRGGDGYEIFRDKALDAYDFGPSLEDAVANYIQKEKSVDPQIEGRISVK